MSRNASSGIFRFYRRYPHLPLTSELDASSWGMRSGFVKRVSRATSQWVLRIYDALDCIIYMQEYRSGHNEAVLKTSFVCLCNFLKTLDFIGFFTTEYALCEKRFSQFSRNFLYGGLSKWS